MQEEASACGAHVTQVTLVVGAGLEPAHTSISPLDPSW